MKKLMILLLLAIVMILPAFKSVDGNAKLPQDGNSKRFQVGQCIWLTDSAITNFEHLDENALTTHVNWDVTNDCDDDSLSIRWTWVDGDSSTATQINADQLFKLKNSETALLTYTVYDSTAIAGGTVLMYISGVCDSTNISLTAGVGKTATLTCDSNASTSDFVITINPDASVTAGKFAIDDIYLTTYYSSPLTILTGEDVTLTTPTNALELVIDPIGTEVQIEIGAYNYHFWSRETIPCVGDEEIIIANDSGSTATVYFYYYMAVSE